MGHYIYMGLTMSISMKPICDVCMYIRMYAGICMHAYMCVCMYVCMHACMHACMCVCVCACVTNKQINSRILQQRRHHDIDPTLALCPPWCTCVCVCVCVCVCNKVKKLTYTPKTYTHTHNSPFEQILRYFARRPHTRPSSPPISTSLCGCLRRLTRSAAL